MFSPSRYDEAVFHFFLQLPFSFHFLIPLSITFYPPFKMEMPVCKLPSTPSETFTHYNDFILLIIDM